MSAVLPKLIEVENGDGRFRLAIDGEEFPWLVADGSIEVAISRGGVPGITLTIMAEHVRLDDSPWAAVAPDPGPPELEESKR